MRRRERLSVVANEAVGPYTLLRLERGGLEPGHPGPVLHARGAGTPPAAADEPLPRAARRARASCSRRSARARARSPRSEPGDELHVLGPLGNGFRLDVEKPLLVGGGIGVAPFPYLSEQLGGPPAILGFRSDWHAEAAALVPNAEVVVEPTLVTEPLPTCNTGHDVLACGPEPMLEAVARARPGRAARLGGADGVRLRRVLRLRGRDRRRAPAALRRRAGPGGRVILNASGCLDALEAPEVARALDAFVTKTVTPLPREGNRPVRIAETEAGMLNSIGLENPGIDGFLADKLPRLAELGVPLWVSVGGFAASDYAELCARSTTAPRWRRSSSTSPARTSRKRRRAPPRSSPRPVRETEKPLYAKLSPAATDLPETAAAPSRPPAPTGSRS